MILLNVLSQFKVLIICIKNVLLIYFIVINIIILQPFRRSQYLNVILLSVDNIFIIFVLILRFVQIYVVNKTVKLN